jgi:hypothetical protein
MPNTASRSKGHDARGETRCRTGEDEREVPSHRKLYWIGRKLIVMGIYAKMVVLEAN